MSGYEIKTIYSVNQGDDDRSPGKPKWWFSDVDRANHVAHKRGWYGGDAPVAQHKVIIVGGKTFRLASDEPINILLDIGPEEIETERQKAMAKLTDHERKILGLT